MKFPEEHTFDILIIGAGVSGTAIARELSRFDASIAVLEKCEDICCGTTKANSAIVHAGFDAPPGSLMAKLNARGNFLMDRIAEELDVPFIRNGSLVICKREEDRPSLQQLLAQGEQNGIPGIRIIERSELRKLEPNISEDAVAALYAPTGGIICPFTLNIAFAENAAANGVQFFLNTEVTGLRRISVPSNLSVVSNESGAAASENVAAGNAVSGDAVSVDPARFGDAPFFSVSTNADTFYAKTVINAAGVHAGTVHNWICKEHLQIRPRKGEYYLLDKLAGRHVSHTIFPLPSAAGKGVLVTPTVHGNLLVGPTSHYTDDPEDLQTTDTGLTEVRSKAGQTVRNIPFSEVITTFSGLRASSEQHDFQIGMPSPGFFDCAGIESPGLSAAPAIGEYTAEMVRNYMNLQPKAHFNSKRQGYLNPNRLSVEERNALIQNHPEYGTVICRCEMVTEGEILDAIRRPLGATTIDGIKRRVRPTSGRCQGGFCTPFLLKLLEKELPAHDIGAVSKCGTGSEYLFGKIKE